MFLRPFWRYFVDFHFENDMGASAKSPSTDLRRGSIFDASLADEQHGCALLRLNLTRIKKRTI